MPSYPNVPVGTAESMGYVEPDGQKNIASTPVSSDEIATPINADQMVEYETIAAFNDAQAAEVQRWQGALDNRTAEVLTRVYVARRLDYQYDYYRRKMRDFESNSNRAFQAGALIMTVTSLLAALGTGDSAPGWLRLSIAILPALAALVASFRQLYQWDRQAQLYKDTTLGLQRASLALPDLDQVDSRTAIRVFPDLVARTEKVFEDEVNQWGQIALGDQEKKEEQDSIIQFAKDYGIDIFNEDGELDDSKVESVRQILAVARGNTKVNSHVDLSQPIATSAGVTVASEQGKPIVSVTHAAATGSDQAVTLSTSDQPDVAAEAAAAMIHAATEEAATTDEDAAALTRAELAASKLGSPTPTDPSTGGRG